MLKAARFFQTCRFRMAYGKLREKLFFILSYFTCIALIQCRSLLQIFDEGSVFSKQYKSNTKGYGSFVNFGNVAKDASVSALQNSLFKGQLVSSDQAIWDAMSPKLRCRDDLMQLQLSGPEVTQVKLCRGNGAPVLLSRLPPHCGQVTPTLGGLVYATPYDGCGVAQREGSYVMQMQWNGKPAVVSCRYLGEPLPMPVTTSVPTTSAVAQAPPQPQGYPQMFWPYYYPSYNGKTQSTVTPTTTTTPAAQDPTQKPQLPAYPPMVWPYFYPYYYGKPKPIVTPTTTTTAPVAQDPIQKPQLPAYPPMFWPYYYPYYYGKTQTTVAPVTTTTPVPPPPTQKPQPPAYPPIFWPYYYPYYYGKPNPPATPVTTTTTAPVAQDPTIKPQPSAYPAMFWPYYYLYYYGKPKPIVSPVTTTAPVAQDPVLKPQPPAYSPWFWPYYPHFHYHVPKFYSQYQVQSPQIPTPPPITAAPQPCPTTTAAECTPEVQNPVYPTADVQTTDEPPQYYVAQRNMLYEKDPFAQFLDSEFDPDPFSRS